MSLKEGKFPQRRPVWDVVINNGSIGATTGVSILGMPADAAAPGYPSWPLPVNGQLQVQMNARGKKQEVRNKLVDVLTDGKMNCLSELLSSGKHLLK